MHILMLNHEFTVTGASVQFLQLAQHLVDQGHRITTMPLGTGDGPMRACFASLGPINATAELAQFDAAIGNTICAAPAIVPISKFLPTIWWPHETEIGLNLVLRNPAWAEAFQAARAIIFQTEFQRDSVYRSFTYRRSTADLPVIPYGALLPPELARDRIVPKQRPIRVVSVGTVEPRKRHADLIHAVSLLPPDKVECVIVGKRLHVADETEQLLARCGSQFRLTGEVAPAESVAWIESGDIYCLCSDSESFPLTLLEAGLLRKPLILTDLPYYRGHYEHGRNCLLYPVGDVELLANAIALLARSEGLRARLGIAAHRLAARHSVDGFFTAFDAVLNSVLVQRRS